MKAFLTIISVIFLQVLTATATINGFYLTPQTSFTVPSTNILVIQQVDYDGAIPVQVPIINVAGASVSFPGQTNGLYALPKPMFLPPGTVVNSDNMLVFGALIAPTDAPLFVSGGCSFGDLNLADNSLTGVLTVTGEAVGSKILFQSSTNFVDWNYDSSVAVRRGSDRTWQFTVPVAGTQCFYRALVRSRNPG
jgi:hypothetical protein